MDTQQPSSSRPSLSDIAPPPVPQGPIPLFDAHLRILSDSYLSFFQERKRIEEVYVDSLVKLHKKIKSFDTYLDDRGELSTTRSVWNEVRDNVEREAQAREAFCNTLVTDILTPLVALKDTQDRTRKRIKEDLKESSLAYNDYAENMLPKLKTRYLRKYAEVEEQKKAAATVSPTSPTLSPTVLPSEPFHHLTNTKSNPAQPPRPTVTGPQPLRPLDRRPSGSGLPHRNRSPSSSTAFSDLAHHGKRQLNTLMGFLDKTGNVKDSLSNRENQALKSVRTKREADEADKEYRKGVHWLETLRLRRTKILEAGFTSLEMFVLEASTTVKKCLERYTDNLTATCTTQSQLAQHARAIVDKISPEKDVAKLKAYIPRSLASAIPERILYEHGSAGPSNDLIFGISLADYATSKGLHEGDLPKIVKICIDEIDRRGLESEGVYRVSGRHAIVQTLQHEFEKNEDVFEFNPQKDDVYAVASLLKQYLRELPEPVFKFPLQDRIQHTEDIADHKANNFMLLRSKIRRLPPVHQATLKALLEHLARVAARSEKNKMDPKNLAIVFGGVIFGEDEMPKGGDLMSVSAWKDTLMEDLIVHAHILYDDHPNTHQSPPLPPTPAGEPAAQYSYGSKSTKVATVPPETPEPPRLPPQVKASPQDFTPTLPARPANSIHPSLRAAATSPSRGRSETPTPPPLPTRPPYQDSPPLSPLALPRRSISVDDGRLDADPFKVSADRANSPLPPTPPQEPADEEPQNPPGLQ